MRVELNAAHEVEVRAIHRNGSAERSGGVMLGDILVGVDGEKIVGLQLSAISPLIRGPRGSTVILALRRPTPSGTAEEITVELTRGTPSYFLEIENARAVAKLQELKGNLVEVEVELDALRGVLEQSDLRSRTSARETRLAQERQKVLQDLIEECNKQVAEERRLRMEYSGRAVDAETDHAARERVRELHEALTRVEVQLTQVMVDLKAEQSTALDLREFMGQEMSLTHSVEERLRTTSRRMEALVASAATEEKQLQSRVEVERRQIRALEVALDELRMREGSEPGYSEATERSLDEDELREKERLQVRIQVITTDLREQEVVHRDLVEVSRQLEVALPPARQAPNTLQAEIDRSEASLRQTLARNEEGPVELREKIAQRRAAESARLQELSDKVLQLRQRALDVRDSHTAERDRLSTLLLERQSAGEDLANRLAASSDNARLRAAIEEKQLVLGDASSAASSLERDAAALRAALQPARAQAAAAADAVEAVDSRVVTACRRLAARENFAASMPIAVRKELESVDVALREAQQHREAAARQLEQIRIDCTKCEEGIAHLKQVKEFLTGRSAQFAALRLRHLERPKEVSETYLHLRELLEGMAVRESAEELGAIARRFADEAEPSFRALQRLADDYRLRAARAAAVAETPPLPPRDAFRQQGWVAPMTSLGGVLPQSAPEQEGTLAQASTIDEGEHSPGRQAPAGTPTGSPSPSSSPAPAPAHGGNDYEELIV
jgi:hypothetical protein